MNPIFLLRELGLLKDLKAALDVGARDGIISARLVEFGLDVDAIDIHEPKEEIEGVSFQKISVENFLEENTKKYNVVIARHVMHHLENPKKVIEELNKIADVFFFTCFGPKDDWAGKVSILEHDEVLSMFKPKSVIHHSEAFQYGKTYAGDTKFWHINTFVIDNRM
jgi:SAM-dependent methyltransferase